MLFKNAIALFFLLASVANASLLSRARQFLRGGQGAARGQPNHHRPHHNPLEFFDVDFVDADCEPQEDEPPCLFGINGEQGAWVCRSLYNPVTSGPMEPFSACIRPEFSVTTDDCGCCGGTCPEVDCGCPCDLDVDGDQAGVFIQPIPAEDGEGPRCVPADVAARMVINQLGRDFECVPDETCPDEST